MRVGFVQCRPRLLKPRENLRMCLEAMRGRRADLWVLPELVTSGYKFRNRKEVSRVAETLSGPLCSALREFAAERDCAVVAGFPERSGRRLYNSAVLALPRRVSLYRKVHLFGDEKRWFSPGDKGFGVEDVGGVKVGMMICFDWFFPESCRTLALKGAEVIAHPANLVLPWAPEAMRTRCLENRVFAVTANRIGSERGLRFIGQSQVAGPDGRVLVRASSSRAEVRVAAIQPARARDKKIAPANDLFKDRRPATYWRWGF